MQNADEADKIEEKNAEKTAEIANAVLAANKRAKDARLQIKRGDCILVTSDGFVGWAIRYIQRRRDELPSYVNHVVLAVTDDVIGNVVVLDAQPPRVTLQFLRDYRGCMLAVYRHRGMSAETGAAVAEYAVNSFNRRRYGLGKILLHLIGLERFAFVDAWPICSWAVTKPLAAVAKLSFGKAYNVAQPDDIHDYVREHPDEWRCVRELRIYE